MERASARERLARNIGKNVILPGRVPQGLAVFPFCQRSGRVHTGRQNVTVPLLGNMGKIQFTEGDRRGSPSICFVCGGITSFTRCSIYIFFILDEEFYRLKIGTHWYTIKPQLVIITQEYNHYFFT